MNRDRATKWCVHITHYALFRVTWTTDAVPTLRELAALRRLSPICADRSISELRAALAEHRSLDFGVYNSPDAQQLTASAKAFGLDLTVTNLSSTTYQIVNATTGCEWVFETDEEAARVAQELIATGAQVHCLEAD